MAEIDSEVIAEMQVNKAVSDDTQTKRAVLNFFAELLSEFKKLNATATGLQNTISMVGEDKLMAFFKELSNNYEKEVKRVTVNKIAKQSHQKAVKEKK